MNERITLEDTTFSILSKMSEGNPGALKVCIDLLEKTKSIDPDNVMGGLGVILSLDTSNIYGSRIWMLYKDVCKENIANVVMILRAWQLGYTTTKDINYAIDNYGKGIDIESLYKQVKERLPNFR